MENQGKCVEYEGQCMKVCDCDKCKIKLDDKSRRLKWTYIFVGILSCLFFIAGVISMI